MSTIVRRQSDNAISCCFDVHSHPPSALVPTMRRPCFCGFPLLLSLQLLLLLSAFVESSSRTSGSSVSPIKHLEASLAASSAHGIVVAVRSFQDQQECVVLVTHRPLDIVTTKTQPKDADSTQELFGLCIPDETVEASWRWTQFGGSGVCAMTGFAADVQHLTRATLRQVESHQTLYSQAMSVDRIVKALSFTMQRAALEEGGRPFGVQALIVGLDKKDKMLLYTVDPTGGWQHYGGGATAIGRGAEEVRTQLYKAKKDAVSSGDLDAKAALRIAISSLVDKSIKDSGYKIADKLEALLVWKSENGSCRLARILDSEVDTCLRSILDKK